MSILHTSIAGTIVMLSMAFLPPALADVVDVSSRGEKIRLLVELPSDVKPTAVIALFAGGHGRVKIKNDGSIKRLGTNFAVRSRGYLLKQGFATAVVGPPSDQNDGNGLKGKRTTSDYTKDLKAVIAHLRKRFGLPVWLHGTSRGSIAVAQAAIALAGTNDAPNGIITSASVLSDNYHTDHVLRMDVEKITIPVLVQHHKKDSCEMTSPNDVPALMARLTKAKAKKALLYSEGDNPSGRECGSLHYHGFIGIGEKVANDMAKFIKENLPKAPLK